MPDSLAQAASINDHAPVKQLSCLAAMRERRGEILCFTPALLVRVARFPVDPAQEYIARFNVPADQQPFCVELAPNSPPFFAGIGTSELNGRRIDWNRRLYAVPKSAADSCFAFLAGISVHNRDSDTYAISLPKDITVPDPVDRNVKIMTRVFCVLKNELLTYLHTWPLAAAPPFVAEINADTSRWPTDAPFIRPELFLAKNQYKLLRGEA